MNSWLRLLPRLALAAIAALTLVRAELEYPYGVIVGTPSSWGLEPFSKDLGIGGDWPHYFIQVGSGSSALEAAIDLSTSEDSDQVRWRELSLDAADFPEITGLPDGWHELASHTDAGASSGGALDFLRHPTILARLDNTPWRNEDDAEPLIEETHPTSSTHRYDVPRWDDLFAQGVRKVFIFGEIYSNGHGVHNVHQNQGDPSGPHSGANGIWQDGAMIIEFNAPKLVPGTSSDSRAANPFLQGAGSLGAFLGGATLPQPFGVGPLRPTANRILVMTRFKVQSDYTDSNGDGYFVYSASRYTGESARAGLMKTYGPFSATSEVQVELANATGRPTVYVRYGSRPTLTGFDSALQAKRTGTLFKRLYSTSGSDLYIGVRSSDATTYDLSVKFHP